ncbi:MAG TPA: electron transport complex subunit RsxE [Peptococcaceae bacterium]|nr:electron transport complex subunit RsxE [Peptococcaceae bacterium]
MKLGKEFTKGIIAENPLFVQVLGTCPSLAVTTSVNNALGMGVAFTAVLVCSNLVISLLRKAVPSDIRIPSYIVVIASFVTMIEMIMNAFAPALYASLGIFIPLIVVNCVILGRAEAFAGKNPALPSIADGLGMGVGYTLAIVAIASIREVLGAGTFLGISILGSAYQPALIMILPAGSFITMGFLFAGMNIYNRRKAMKKEVM